MPGRARGGSDETEATATSTRTAIYARVSTRERGRDTQNQLHQLRGLAARQGWLIVIELVDYERGKA